MFAIILLFYIILLCRSSAFRFIAQPSPPAVFRTSPPDASPSGSDPIPCKGLLKTPVLSTTANILASC